MLMMVQSVDSEGFDPENEDIAWAFTPAGAVWGAFGLSREDSVPWIGAGFTDPADTVEWRALQFDPTEARACVEQGIEPAAAVARRSDGVSPEADEQDRGWLVCSLEEWQDSGFTPAEALVWLEVAIEPATAKVSRDAGLSPGDAAASWESAGFGREDRRKWTNHFTDPQRAAYWVDWLSQFDRPGFQFWEIVEEAASLDSENPSWTPSQLVTVFADRLRGSDLVGDGGENPGDPF